MMEILASEWTKMRSVRSTVWTLASTALLMLAIGVLLALAVAGSADGPVNDAEATRVSMAGVTFASLAIATLGVLVVSSEYRTGAIRTSLMAVPRRLRLLSGKIIVFTVVALVACLASSVATFLIAQAILDGPALGEPGTLRTVAGTGLYLTASGLFGLALGALVRHTPGAIVAAIALILVLPQLTNVLPGEWGTAVHNHFTSNAGLQIAMPVESNPLGPWSGFGVYLAWIAVTLVAAAVLMRRRDA
ncbi:ABC transporter permease [Nonomuraea cavernae]|uniref:ABC transporter permease n=1 Tax=Nonomuraea cavernae TaxID=2045107 RepID=A0A917YXR7_9ACTN|nr:ABC transporter permease [Nonomuraea cavernae]MCA2186219.1 ABC transporter permease subunit [Nonomuraea cavernae]GGO69855.1 ABC transporter permease [Nonomuraea cavernae]